MVNIETTTTLEKFRKFLIYSTCKSFIPKGYLKDSTIFPEREDAGTIYIECSSKINLKKIKGIQFVKVNDVLGILYASKSGNTKLKWRQIAGRMGRLSGEASLNALVNLIEAGIITKKDVMKQFQEKEEEGTEE
ncbi:MAG: hypothetical protein QXV10_04125 [Nitrososphaerota archaeon]